MRTFFDLAFYITALCFFKGPVYRNNELRGTHLKGKGLGKPSFVVFGEICSALIKGVL